MKYRIRYHLWSVEAPTAEQAKKIAVDLLQKNTERFVSVELSALNRPLWKMLLTGR